SPSGTSCPRCGTIYHAFPGQAGSEQDALLPQAGNFTPGNIPAGPNVQPGHVGAEAAYAQWNAYPISSSPYEAPAGYPAQAGQDSSLASDKEKAFFVRS